MVVDHPNIELLGKLDLGNLGAMSDLFAPEFVWHYFNPKLPDLEGDYLGLDGLQAFFGKLANETGGTFKVEPLSASAFGDELVVAHVRDTLSVEGQGLSIDALAIWRIVDGKLAEAWDIPAVHTAKTVGGADGTQE